MRICRHTSQYNSEAVQQQQQQWEDQKGHLQHECRREEGCEVLVGLLELVEVVGLGS